MSGMTSDSFAPSVKIEIKIKDVPRLEALRPIGINIAPIPLPTKAEKNITRGNRTRQEFYNIVCWSLYRCYEYLLVAIIVSKGNWL